MSDVERFCRCLAKSADVATLIVVTRILVDEITRRALEVQASQLLREEGTS